MKTEIENLTSNQKQILDYLKAEDVRLKYIGKKHYLTMFGLKYKEITQSTFDAIYPYLNHHNDDTYSLNPTHF